LGNNVYAPYGFIGGGLQNRIESTANQGFIGGGVTNTVSAIDSVIVGGLSNTAESTGDYSFIGGGQLNLVKGSHASVPGGYRVNATGDYSLAAGYNVNAGGASGADYTFAFGRDFANDEANSFQVGFASVPSLVVNNTWVRVNSVMKLNPLSTAPVACDSSADEGVMFMSSTDHQLHVCNGTGWGYITAVAV
jgi:hypothetical protein